MKKIISLLIATAMSVTAFASIASAAQITSSNKATLTVTCAEVDWEDPSILTDAKDFTEGDYDSYICYRFTITAGNLPELKYASKKYTGEGITSIAARFNIDTTAEEDVDWALYVPAGKGTFTPDGSGGYGFSYIPANDLGKLVVAEAVAAGGSQNLATFDMVVAKDYDYDVEFATGNMAAAVFSGVAATKGTNAYDVTPAFDNLTINAETFSLPLSSAPATTTYTITFKTYDGASDVAVQTVDEGDTITAPTAPTRTGFTFAYWSEAQDGAEATIGTASADKTYYAVYTQDPPAEEIINPVENKSEAQDIGTTALTDLQGNPVNEFKKNYGIAKFDTAITTGDKNYFVVATDDKAEEKQFAVDFSEIGVEAENANVSFFAIVKSATHKIVSVVLKAVAK